MAAERILLQRLLDQHSQPIQAFPHVGVTQRLTIAEDIPNEEMISMIHAADVVLDQLIVGWYAMLAMEGMALGKPVICHIRPQYRDLYVGVGLLDEDELPLVDSSKGDAASFGIAHKRRA